MKEVLILHFHFDRNEKKYEYVSNMVCIVIEQTLFTLSQYITMYHMAHSHIPALPHTIILSITKYDHQSFASFFCTEIDPLSYSNHDDRLGLGYCNCKYKQ